MKVFPTTVLAFAAMASIVAADTCHQDVVDGIKHTYSTLPQAVVKACDEATGGFSLINYFTTSTATAPTADQIDIFTKSEACKVVYFDFQQILGRAPNCDLNGASLQQQAGFISFGDLVASRQPKGQSGGKAVKGAPVSKDASVSLGSTSTACTQADLDKVKATFLNLPSDVSSACFAVTTGWTPLDLLTSNSGNPTDAQVASFDNSGACKVVFFDYQQILNAAPKCDLSPGEPLQKQATFKTLKDLVADQKTNDVVGSPVSGVSKDHGSAGRAISPPLSGNQKDLPVNNDHGWGGHALSGGANAPIDVASAPNGASADHGSAGRAVSSNNRAAVSSSASAPPCNVGQIDSVTSSIKDITPHYQNCTAASGFDLAEFTSTNVYPTLEQMQKFSATPCCQILFVDVTRILSNAPNCIFYDKTGVTLASLSQFTTLDTLVAFQQQQEGHAQTYTPSASPSLLPPQRGAVVANTKDASSSSGNGGAAAAGMSTVVVVAGIVAAIGVIVVAAVYIRRKLRASSSSADADPATGTANQSIFVVNANGVL
ncbi:Aste57867_15381 [Aphanomyces stellatus]|uniref:Aste57867_15381 protein n=1 Tax=Aphanomyces stellatus TaxID=120398 RepID=A0A485L5W8_9STRA|nr:hypothetical protein As57867_015325 [Aphanomyces stellatus]VFT92187.1 Aste57867_15381 [Aphanomyces stellatus]